MRWINKNFKHLIILACIHIFFVSCEESWPGLNYDKFKNTIAEPLAKAVKDEDLKTIEKLVQVEKIPVDFQDSLGQTLLKVAILSKKKKSITKLLELGANPNIKDIANETPFLFACDMYKFEGCDIDLIELLLKYHADINTRQISVEKYGNYFNTPLIVSIDISSADRHDDLFYFLIKNGADINQFGQNPSYCAVMGAAESRMDLLKFLVIDRKANIPEYAYIWNEGTKDEKRETLVQYLKEKDYTKGSTEDILRNDVIAYLIKNGYK